MNAQPSRAARKDEHVDLALAQPVRANEFDDVDFVHHALGATDVASVELETDLGEFAWPVPFYINGMTGGTEKTGAINRALAVGAAEIGVPMACGSVSVALDDPRAAESFTVIRKENPRGFVMANIGVGRSADDAKRAVELLEADALQVHINAVQEIVMPEGEREFSNWEKSLEEIATGAGVPVIVKEVGFGLSVPTLELLAGLGIKIADVGGRGGTDFAQIENSRRRFGEFSYLAGFGQSAPACLLDAGAGLAHGADLARAAAGAARAPRASGPGLALLASGGVRSAFDAVKSLALGARAAGVASQFLRAAMVGEDAVVLELRTWKEQIRSLMALLGARSVDELAATDVVVRGDLAEWCRARGIDLTGYAHRSERAR